MYHAPLAKLDGSIRFGAEFTARMASFTGR